MSAEDLSKNIRTATTTEEQPRTIVREPEQRPTPQAARTEEGFRATPRLNKSPLHGIWALTNRDLVKWYKSPIQLFISLIQPVVWLGLFGKALNFGAFITNSGAPQSVVNSEMLSIFGTTSYFSFLAAGMLAFIILFTSAFSGMSVVFDRRFGFMNKALSTPVGRGAIVMGKVLQSVIRSLILATIVLGVSTLLGFDTSHLTVLGILGSYTILFLMSFALSSLFVMLALRSSEWQTQMAIINLLNLPLLFASNALLPVKIMPDWLQTVVKFNPISYANDAVRVMLLGAQSASGLLLDFAVMIGFAAVLAGLGIVLSWKLLSK